jgi:hypothetical protein
MRVFFFYAKGDPVMMRSRGGFKNIKGGRGKGGTES